LLAQQHPPFAPPFRVNGQRVIAHDTHHPLATHLFYEDQQNAAVMRARAFCEQRMPKFLAWFESVLERYPALDG